MLVCEWPRQLFHAPGTPVDAGEDALDNWPKSPRGRSCQTARRNRVRESGMKSPRPSKAGNKTSK